jgi:ascorbate PTS system EIIC component
MEFFEFLMNEILSLPEVLVGLIVMVGLLLQKADFSKIFAGTTKSIIGFLILGAGAGVIIGSLDALGGIIQDRFDIQGVIPNNEAIVALAQQTLGTETALIMGFGFLANILYARFTPLKYIFLTGHHTFFMAALLSAVLATAGMSGIALVTTGSLILGGVMVLMPALAQPFMRKITGGNEIAMGHFGTIGYVSAGLVAKAVGNEKKTTEDIKIPEQWSFLRDLTDFNGPYDGHYVPDSCTRGRSGSCRHVCRRSELYHVRSDAGDHVRSRFQYHYVRSAHDPD